MKLIILIQRVMDMDFEALGQTHPGLLHTKQWNTWKEKIIEILLSKQKDLIGAAAHICGKDEPIDLEAITKNEGDLGARLETRILRPKNFPLHGGENGEVISSND
jgi:hypothetical protein